MSKKGHGIFNLQVHLNQLSVLLNYLIDKQLQRISIYFQFWQPLLGGIILSCLYIHDLITEASKIDGDI